MAHHQPSRPIWSLPSGEPKARPGGAALGRFYQTDPVLYADQFNLYAYVGNDPLNMTDPSGAIKQAVPVPTPVPMPLPPVAIPGTPENQEFVDQSRTGIEALGNAIEGIFNNDSSDDDSWRRTRNYPGDEPPDDEPEGPQDSDVVPPLFIPEQTQHGGDRAEERRIPIMAQGDAITNSESINTWGDNNTTLYYNPGNNLTVVISNYSGEVVTAHKGMLRGRQGDMI